MYMVYAVLHVCCVVYITCIGVYGVCDVCSVECVCVWGVFVCGLWGVFVWHVQCVWHVGSVCVCVCM